MLKTPIKASQIGNLTDARYFAAWGVEWMGFSLDPSLGEVLPINQIKEIKNWVEGPKMVGEFGIQSTEEILAITEFLNLDIIQLNEFAILEQAKDLVQHNLIKEFVISGTIEISKLQNRIDEFQNDVKHFLLNFRKSNLSWDRLSSNEKNQLNELSQSHSIILSMNINPTDLNLMIENYSFEGLEVLGGVEEKVGLKSFDELDELFELIELD